MDSGKGWLRAFGAGTVAEHVVHMTRFSSTNLTENRAIGQRLDRQETEKPAKVLELPERAKRPRTWIRRQLGPRQLVAIRLDSSLESGVAAAEEDRKTL